MRASTKPRKPAANLPSGLAGLLILGLCCLSGCQRLETEYGPSHGVSGQRSIAGFGVTREYFRRQDWNDRTVPRLSERLNNVDAIVWTSSVNQAPSNAATQWFNEWFARGDKTLVYIVRDHQIVDRYWHQAAKLAEPEQRLEYRRRAARARMDKLQALLQRPSIITNGWFTAVSLTPPSQIQTTAGTGQANNNRPQNSGRWASDVPQLPATLELEFSLRAYDEQQDKPAAAVAPLPNFLNQPPEEIVDSEANFVSLLQTSGGETVVGKVTSPAWPNSQILVVAAGSLLTNYGLLDSAPRELLAQLEQASRPSADITAPKVGFLFTDEFGARVSSLDPEQMGPSGMEMLTTWPINIISIHALVCGLLVTLMLFPILGRPQRKPAPTTTDFAAHIDAVAGLMAKTRGEQYAKVRISEYFVRVRGEDTGPWVIPASQSTAELPAIAPTNSQQASNQSTDQAGPID